MSDAWLSRARIDERRIAAAGPLAMLADSLAADLEPVLAAPIEIPREKARLSRAGGRCPRDGTMLRFDPFTPRRHACPACGATYDDEAHHRWWIMGFHLWLAERAVHAATLFAVRGEERHARFAADVLARYADAYLRWPNVDNVLGPTRPFFSTYLESIWLLQLCIAVELLEHSAAPLDGGSVRDRLVAPSAALIASFDEGMSNRQTWNDAALLAAGRLLGDHAMVERAVRGPSGLHAHLERALLADGTWYEGENYHLFAHRGLWYGVLQAEVAGHATPAHLARRFDEGFATPFVTALPDLTFPARRDSQHAVSLRQWRFAELAELGLARCPRDARLAGALARLYDGDARPGDTGRARSTAEAERNEPAVALTRASLGWRSLMFAQPELPPLRAHASGSVLLAAQGFAVLRRDAGRTYVALDYGVSGGGHGHPDRLGALLAVGADRWLDDPGTGSYVDPSLFWYRSTLAHNAPLVDGRTQPPLDGRLLAWEDRGGAGWVRAGVRVPPSNASLERTLVVMPGYVVDELRWTCERDVRVALPAHAPGMLDGPHGWERATPPFEGAEHVRDAERVSVAAGDVARLVGPDARPRAFALASHDATWWRATRPGAPGRDAGPVHVAEVGARRGAITTVWSLDDVVESIGRTNDGLAVRLRDRAVHTHRETDDGWHVDLVVGAARSSIDLGGRVAVRDEPPPPAPPAPTRGPLPTRDAPLHECLGEPHYRRSELSWRDAGAPTAAVALHADDDALHVAVHVRKPALALVPTGAANDMENERAEIHGDGVQIHVAAAGADGAAAGDAAWLLAPAADGTVRVLPSRPDAGVAHATWRRTDDGWTLNARVPLASVRATVPARGRLGVDVLVNEGAPGRERRQGQLALGGGGDTVYLQGDRRDRRRLLWFDDPDA